MKAKIIFEKEISTCNQCPYRIEVRDGHARIEYCEALRKMEIPDPCMRWPGTSKDSIRIDCPYIIESEED